MANNSKITGIRKKASSAVDKAEGTINRFARFMGAISKSKEIPSQSTLKKARKFAKNFGSGRSSKVNKMLLGSALMLPLVLGSMMAKNQSTEEILQNQYGGDEKAMQKDLKEEQNIRDKGLEKVEATADENKDISMDRQQDVSEVSQQEPEQSELKPEQSEDETTLEKLNRGLDSDDDALNEKTVKQFEELMERFAFLEKQGAFLGEQGPSLAERLNNFRKDVMKNIRNVTGGEVDDGVFSLGMGVEVANPFSEKGRNIIKETLGNTWNRFFGKNKDKDKTDIQMIEETVQAQIEAAEKKFQDAGGIRLDPNSKEYKEYITTKTQLEKLQTRIKEEPLQVVAEFQSAANPSTVSAQTNMLNVDTGDMDLKKKIRQLESGNDYSSMYSRNRDTFARGAEDITKMTIDEVHDLQTDYLNHQKALGYDSADGSDRSAAMGAYQMMEVKAIAKSMGFDTSKTLFNKETQDKMSEYYLNYAGYQKWKAGEISDQEFNDGLAGQFASVKKASGVGAYDNDGMNNAYGNLMPLLQKLREGGDVKTDPTGDQSSLEPNNPNAYAALNPEGYMPYDDPVATQPQVALAPPTSSTTNMPTRMNGDSTEGGIVTVPVTDNGAVLSLMQLHNLALT
jgi:hypothetical protein